MCFASRSATGSTCCVPASGVHHEYRATGSPKGVCRAERMDQLPLAGTTQRVVGGVVGQQRLGVRDSLARRLGDAREVRDVLLVDPHTDASLLQLSPNRPNHRCMDVPVAEEHVRLRRRRHHFDGSSSDGSADATSAARERGPGSTPEERRSKCVPARVSNCAQVWQLSPAQQVQAWLYEAKKPAGRRFESCRGARARWLRPYSRDLRMSLNSICRLRGSVADGSNPQRS